VRLFPQEWTACQQCTEVSSRPHWPRVAVIRDRALLECNTTDQGPPVADQAVQGVLCQTVGPAGLRHPRIPVRGTKHRLAPVISIRSPGAGPCHTSLGGRMRRVTTGLIRTRPGQLIAGPRHRSQRRRRADALPQVTGKELAEAGPERLDGELFRSQRDRQAQIGPRLGRLTVGPPFGALAATAMNNRAHPLKTRANISRWRSPTSRARQRRRPSSPRSASSRCRPH
jgi:hypothetical protein